MIKLTIAGVFGAGFLLVGYVGVMRAVTTWLTARVLLSVLVPLSPVFVMTAGIERWSEARRAGSRAAAQAARAV